WEAESKEEELARLALSQEDVGDLGEALKSWSALAKNKGAADKDKHAWGLVGQKHHDQLKAYLYKHWPALFDRVKVDQDFQGATAEEEVAVKAIRAEQAKDFKAALQLWQDLKKLTED